MPWSASKEGTLPSLKNKSLEARQLFAEVANKAMAGGKGEEYSIRAGLAAVSNLEHKKKKLAKAALEEQKQSRIQAEESYVAPSHLSALIEAANIKKQKELLAIAEQNAADEAFKNDVINTVTNLLGDSIVDMKVQGEDALLVKRNGKKVKRKLADYNVEQRTVIAPAQLQYEPVTMLNGTEPEIVFLSNGDIVMSPNTYL